MGVDKAGGRTKIKNVPKGISCLLADRKLIPDNAYRTVIDIPAGVEVVRGCQSVKISEGSDLENHLSETAPHRLDFSDPKVFQAFMNAGLPHLQDEVCYVISKRQWIKHVRAILCMNQLGLSEQDWATASKQKKSAMVAQRKPQIRSRLLAR